MNKRLEAIELTEEEFIDQMTTFSNQTSQEIVTILLKEGYALPTAIFGLISLVRSVIDTYGESDPRLYAEATRYLNLKPEDLNVMSSDIEDDENIIKEQD